MGCPSYAVVQKTYSDHLFYHGFSLDRLDLAKAGSLAQAHQLRLADATHRW
jgi:hypothetical protein